MFVPIVAQICDDILMIVSVGIPDRVFDTSFRTILEQKSDYTVMTVLACIAHSKLGASFVSFLVQISYDVEVAKLGKLCPFPVELHQFF